MFAFPIQGILANVMFQQHMKSVTFTDQRTRITTEVLSGIRLIKYYAWEQFYAHEVGKVREREIQAMVPWASVFYVVLCEIRVLTCCSRAAQASLMGFVSVVPIVGTVLSIVRTSLCPWTISSR